MTEKAFKESMGMICSMFPLPIEIVPVYWNVLKWEEWTDQEFQKMTVEVIKTFRPTSSNPHPVPADYIEIAEVKKKEIGNVIVNKLKSAVIKHGRYSNVSFNDPKLHRAIEVVAGSWGDLCKWSDDDWKFKERRLIEVYLRTDEPGSEILVGFTKDEDVKHIDISSSVVKSIGYNS